jgi:hypothetical protein
MVDRTAGPNGKWFKKGGNVDDVETLLIGDSNMRKATEDPARFAIWGSNQVVAIPGGQLQHVSGFFDDARTNTYCQVRNIMIIGIGMNDLCKKGPNDAQVPHHDKVKVLKDYENLINELHAKFPFTWILTTDIIPRQTEGFANHNAALIADKMSQQYPLHHHLNFFKKYTRHHGQALKEQYFDGAGMHLIEGQIQTLIESAYEALFKVEMSTGLRRSYLTEPGYVLKFWA